MINVKSFVFNPFQENTYILYDDTKECVIIDPGCCNERERQQLRQFIAAESLQPVRLLNTHGHIDHVFGNRYIADEFQVKLHLHPEDLVTLNRVMESAKLYQIPYDRSPEPEGWLEDGDRIRFGGSELEVLFVPGHAPGHVAFADREGGLVIGGDVLFRGTVGRTDLPGSNHDLLIRSIRTKLLPLGDTYIVYPGHGPSTTIADEMRRNPFLK